MTSHAIIAATPPSIAIPSDCVGPPYKKVRASCRFGAKSFDVKVEGDEHRVDSTGQSSPTTDTGDTTMTSIPISPTNVRRRSLSATTIGRIVTALPVLFLVFDTGIKFTHVD